MAAEMRADPAREPEIRDLERDSGEIMGRLVRRSDERRSQQSPAADAPEVGRPSESPVTAPETYGERFGTTQRTGRSIPLRGLRSDRLASRGRAGKAKGKGGRARQASIPPLLIPVERSNPMIRPDLAGEESGTDSSMPALERVTDTEPDTEDTEPDTPRGIRGRPLKITLVAKDKDRRAESAPTGARMPTPVGRPKSFIPPKPNPGKRPASSGPRQGLLAPHLRASSSADPRNPPPVPYRWEDKNLVNIPRPPSMPPPRIPPSLFEALCGDRVLAACGSASHIS